MTNRMLLACVFVACGSPFQTAAQPAASAAPRVVATLYVSAMPGFTHRAGGESAGAGILLDVEAPQTAFSAVTIESDHRARCSSSGHAPAPAVPEVDPAATAVWRVEATPVSIGADEATVDLRWSRRVPRPGRIFESTIERQERLTLRDGARGILDVVRSTGEVPGVCDSFAIALELRFQSTNDERDAALGYDLWLIDRSHPSSAPLRVRTQGRQGADVRYAFPPTPAAGSDGPIQLSVDGILTGRARRDGTIDLTFDTRHLVSDESGFRSGGGRKRIAVRAGETIEFELSEAQRAKLPAELQERDFVMRVTTERLW